MSILPQLAGSLQRRDEVPNQELAHRIADTGDTQAVQELVENLAHKNKDIQHDCIKVLYEIGERRPALIVPHADAFLRLLGHKNNRLQWGAMAALDHITQAEPQTVFASLAPILAAVDKGSVITRDHAMNILIRLSAMEPYTKTAFPLLLEQLHTCPANQLPMYAERAAHLIHAGNKAPFVKALRARLDDIDKDSKRKRVEKVIRKLG